MVTVSSVVCVQFVCREGHGDFVSSVVCVQFMMSSRSR